MNKDMETALKALHDWHREAYLPSSSPYFKEGGEGRHIYEHSVIRPMQILDELSNKQKFLFMELVPGITRDLQKDFDVLPQSQHGLYYPKHHWKEIESEYVKTIDILNKLPKCASKSEVLRELEPLHNFQTSTLTQLIVREAGHEMVERLDAKKAEPVETEDEEESLSKIS
ncbi:hypothetical protein ACKX2L_05870 [Lachnospiraceae bacterium YH-ros2228]